MIKRLKCKLWQLIAFITFDIYDLKHWCITNWRLNISISNRRHDTLFRRTYARLVINILNLIARKKGKRCKADHTPISRYGFVTLLLMTFLSISVNSYGIQVTMSLPSICIQLTPKARGIYDFIQPVNKLSSSLRKEQSYIISTSSVIDLFCFGLFYVLRLKYFININTFKVCSVCPRKIKIHFLASSVYQIQTI